MRRQISNHLQNRAKTIRSAIQTYNRAAAALSPPLEAVKFANLFDVVYLAQFDLLRFSRPGNDIRQEPWADPATRVLTDKYFELVRAKEEIIRLNLEWRRVRTWLLDEKRLYHMTIAARKF